MGVHGVENRYGFYVVLDFDIFDDLHQVLTEIGEGAVLAHRLERLNEFAPPFLCYSTVYQLRTVGVLVGTFDTLSLFPLALL